MMENKDPRFETTNQECLGNPYPNAMRLVDAMARGVWPRRPDFFIWLDAQKLLPNVGARWG